MLTSSFQPAMTEAELIESEQRYSKEQTARRLAMTAGLTKSSDELAKTWASDQPAYVTTLAAAIAAYEDNRNLEELLRGAVARLVSVVDRTPVIQGGSKYWSMVNCLQSSKALSKRLPDDSALTLPS